MKYLKIFFMAAMIFGLSACSGSSGYSPAKCKALIEKVKSGDQLTESDYNEMIDQFGAAAKLLAEKQQAIGDDKDAKKELKTSEEGKELFETVLGLGIYLKVHEKDLTPENQKRLAQLEEEVKKLNSGN